MAKSQSNGFVSLKNIKLQQMVSLALMKSSSVSGPIKKMLHVPTFSIYCVKEIPISSRDTRAQLKKWIIEWESALLIPEGKNHLASIHGTHWNSPEGCVSLIMEYINGGSLFNLLESVGALPENILLEITDSLLKSLNFMHNKAKISHNGLSMSQIMFDREGHVKINLGISQIFPKGESSYKSSLGPSKLNLYSAHEINSPARIKKMTMFNDPNSDEAAELSERHIKEVFAQDIFDLGYILLISAVGGLDLVYSEELDFTKTEDA
jgi:serine/threonine protein kinase